MPNIPLYREIVNSNFRIQDQANLGLVFEKYFTRVDKDHKSEELKKFEKKKFNDELNKELVSRQQKLVEQMGGRLLFFENKNSRFITGMGRMHIIENGFSFHSLSGAPYLPGSSLKGAVKAWLRIAEESEVFEKKRGEIFGSSTTGVGNYIFLDMLPIKMPHLVVEFMTPHYSNYYDKKEAPGDWQDPNPIPFLAVDENCTWQIGIIPKNDFAALKENMDQVLQYVKDTLSILGVGAKTAVGYGRFEENASNLEFYLNQKKKNEKVAEEAKVQKEFLANASPELQELAEMAKKENWLESKNYFKQIPEYLKKFPNPSTDCVEWIRDNCIMTDDKGKKLWKNPRVVNKKGKLKNKINQIEVVEMLKKLFPE